LAIQVISPNVSSEASTENSGAVLWEPEPERQMRMAGEMVKAEEINKSDEFAMERNDILNQNAQAWRVKIKSAEQLDETSKLKDDAIKKLETNLVGAILELESERQTRKAAETAKADLDTLLNDLKVILNKELEKNYELKCQRDWKDRKSVV